VRNWERWQDSFDRDESEKVSNGWTEENEGPSGIQIRIQSKTARLSGAQRDANQIAFLSRSETTDRFARIEAVIGGLEAAYARFGVRIEKRGSKGEVEGAILIARDIDGSLSYNYMEEKSKWKSSDAPIPIESFPLDAGSHVFGIGLVDAKSGTFELLFDGRKVGPTIVCSPLARAKELVVGVYGEADSGVGWTLIVEKVRIFRRRN
jgi:hypothetical protein